MPPDIFNEPPVDDALAPPPIVTSPPSPVSLSPAIISIPPAESPKDAPVVTEISPDDPPEALPVVMLALPPTVLGDIVLAVAISMLPLVPLALWPERTFTLPPAAA